MRKGILAAYVVLHLCSSASFSQISCPIADPLCSSLASQCVTGIPGTDCFAKKLVVDPMVPGGIRAVECACFTSSDCGTIQYVAAVNAVRCTGVCPVPPAGNECQVIVTIPPPMGSGTPTPSGTNFLNIAPYPPGTTFECGCVTPPPPLCQANTAGSACNPTQCPPDAQGLPQQCLPVCIKVTSNGQQEIVDCSCMPDTQCHIEFGPVPGLPHCVGDCPPGYICHRTETYNPADNSTTYCCQCIPPPICEPDPATMNATCKPVQCPIPGQECRPKCIEISNQGVITVQNCTCDSPNSCHAEMGPALPFCVGDCPPGKICIQRITPTANGTAYCCECVDDPPDCVPNDTGTACKPFACPPDAQGIPQECQPKCVRYYPATGQAEITDCDCLSIDIGGVGPECHVELGGPPPSQPFCDGACPPGFYCVTNRINHPDGSYTLCCDCVEVQCECPGDIDGNGILNGLDIAGFIRCMLGTSIPGDNCACADIDEDGDIDATDMALFINRILTKAQCNPTPCCPPADLNLDLATGRDDQGNVIPSGNDDDNWVVTLDPNGGSVPRPAEVVTPHPSWVTFPGTSWISANYFGINGDYTYKFCFCLDDRAKNPVLSLQVRADDAGQVFLNGNFIGNASGFSVVNVPVIGTNNAAFFVKGENCIEVRVQNIGGAPTGFNMIGSVTADDGKCCCPPADLSKDIRSGVYDYNGPFIPVGQDDDTWTVTCDATGGTVPRPAQVIAPHNAWATIPGTQWVSATTGATNGLYCYQYCFCLDPRFKNAKLTMDLLADDSATVWLNGVQIGATPNGWAFLNPPTHIEITNQALFRPCENCIEIRVINGGGVVTGMDVLATITADDGLCCDDRELACCYGPPFPGCIDLAPGVTECPPNPGPGQLIDGPCGNGVSCCMPDGSCTILPLRCCLLAGGSPLPAGVTCSGSVEACCYQGPGGGVLCVNTDTACCSAVYNGMPQGAGSVCQGDSNNDGNDDLCVPPPPSCPLGTDFGSQFCQQVQPFQCQGSPTSATCRPKTVITNGPGQGIFVEQCSCYSQTTTPCGPISIQPAATMNDYILSCSGVCGPGAGCTLHVNGSPFGGSSVNTANLPAGSTVTCRCFIP